MVLNSLTIGIQRTGNTAKLVVTGFNAVQTDLTWPELYDLVRELSSELRDWPEKLNT